MPPATPTGSFVQGSPTPKPCAGDCDGDGRVTIGELIRGVNIALERADLATCGSIDSDANGSVGIGELVMAVNRSLHGC